MKHIKFLNYLVLCAILVGGVSTFYYVRPNVNLQFVVGVVTSVFYVLWGIIHHVLNKDLRKKVVVEYLLIGAIALVLLATILKI